MSDTSFASVNLQPDLLANLSSLNYTTMTPIQAQSLPHILAGEDIIAQAKTGSGKTAAFGLGLLESLNTKHFQVQSLVLCPTRELSDQVAKEVRRLARSIQNIKVMTLCGGAPLRPQADSLKYGAHIVVGTPGRIVDHLGKGTLRFDDLTILVLDEADRMLEMGFQGELDKIFGQLPNRYQTLLFSATYPDQIASLAKRIMTQPVRVKVDSTHDNNVIQQHFYPVIDHKQRLTALRLLLMDYQPNSTVIFCNTKKDVREVTSHLQTHGFSVLALHGDLEQRERDQILVRFSNNSASILVATDVAARGLDIEALDAVFNYHIARDSEVYIHRIGRTGRAGSKGIACSLYADKESYKMALLEEYLDIKIEGETLPSVNLLDKPIRQPTMATLKIEAGKKQKVRPGDILGALTGNQGIGGKQVGKINIFDNQAYVAVNRNVVKPALRKLIEGKLKGRSFKVRAI